MSSPTYLSLAEYLDHEYDLIALHQHPQVTSCDELIIIHDGHHIAELTSHLDKIVHRERRIINLGCPLPQSLSSQTVPYCSFEISLDEVNRLQTLHKTVKSLLNAPPPTPHLLHPRIFISHAVHDEALLIPSIRQLRTHYQLQVFICADSITLGDDWYTIIERNLRQSDFVIAACSDHFTQSTFCAFEMGMARALELPIYPMLLDHNPPPHYLQHLNAVNVTRLMNTYQWLSRQDALLQAIFSCLQSFNMRSQLESQVIQ